MSPDKSSAIIGVDAVPPEFAEADANCTFGPTFFLRQLRAFLRDRCPDPSEALPSVQLHLAEGEIIEMCHIIGLAPRWLAIAAIETVHAISSPAMRTEVIPYGLVSRITVRPVRPGPGHVGFEESHGCGLLTRPDAPEDVFLAMAGMARSPEGSQSEPKTGDVAEGE